MDKPGEEIDRLRRKGLHAAADVHHFNDDGRCRVCEKLIGGDRRHRCWALRAVDPEALELARGVMNACLQGPVPLATVSALASEIIRLHEGS